MGAEGSKEGLGAGGGQHSAWRCNMAHLLLCPGVPTTPLTHKHLSHTSRDVGLLTGLVVPVTQCCPPPLQDLETHLFDMTLQEWMKLTLT